MAIAAHHRQGLEARSLARYSTTGGITENVLPGKAARTPAISPTSNPETATTSARGFQQDTTTTQPASGRKSTAYATAVKDVIAARAPELHQAREELSALLRENNQQLAMLVNFLTDGSKRSRSSSSSYSRHRHRRHRSHHRDRSYRGEEDRSYRGDDRSYRGEEDRSYRGEEDRSYRGEDRIYRGEEDRSYRGEDRIYRGEEDRSYRGEDRSYRAEDRSYRGDEQSREDDRERYESRGRGGHRERTGDAGRVASSSGAQLQERLRLTDMERAPSPASDASHASERMRARARHQSAGVVRGAQESVLAVTLPSEIQPTLLRESRTAAARSNAEN
jgi:hypothetical protein